MTRKIETRTAAKTRRVDDDRQRERQWRRWGAYLADYEWALLFEQEFVPVRVETTR